MLTAIRRPRFLLRSVRVLGLLLASYGALRIATGGPFYANWWGGTVFAPLVLAVGIALIVWAPRIVAQSRSRGNRATRMAS